MTDGLKVEEINALSRRLRELAAKAAFHRYRASSHTTAAEATEREADAVQDQLARCVRDSQHDVEVIYNETNLAPPVEDRTPPLPVRKL